jgi:hypothetical protein
MLKRKQTSLFVDIVMCMFGISQLVLIAVYILSAKSASCDGGPGFAHDCNPGLAVSVISGAISLAYFLFITILTALSASNLMNKLKLKR